MCSLIFALLEPYFSWPLDRRAHKGSIFSIAATIPRRHAPACVVCSASGGIIFIIFSKPHIEVINFLSLQQCVFARLMGEEEHTYH